MDFTFLRRIFGHAPRTFPDDPKVEDYFKLKLDKLRSRFNYIFQRLEDMELFYSLLYLHQTLDPDQYARLD